MDRWGSDGKWHCSNKEEGPGGKGINRGSKSRGSRSRGRYNRSAEGTGGVAPKAVEATDAVRGKGNTSKGSSRSTSRAAEAATEATPFHALVRGGKVAL